MAADAFTPRTTPQRLPTPLNGTIYTTTRVVAQEKPLPAIGGTMEAELGPAWADSIIIGVTVPPENSKGILTITHVRIPTEADQLASNWEQVNVPVGGKQFPGVVRSVILPAAAYRDDTPAIDSPLPVIPGGLFDGDGYVLYDRECVKSGMELEPTFRVDRRTYVKTSTLQGSEFAPSGTLMATTDQIVNDGTAPDQGLNVADSTVTPDGTGKSTKQTRIAKRRPATGTDTPADGWPKKQRKSKGVEDLTPQKFRGQVTTAVTTTQEPLAQADVDDIPTPANPAGDQTTITHEKVNDYRYEKTITTETIAENTSALTGEEYGDIVTKSISEIIVEEGTPADSGIDVISSTVDPLGNGKAIKQTKRAKDPGWPDPLDREVTKDGSDTPPPRYRKDLTRTKVTRKIPLADVPTVPDLTGNEIAKAYKKETPDRAEESITTETFTLNMTSVDSSIEQKPFVQILSRMTPGTEPVVPETGNGSAKLVYEGPDGAKIFENVAEIATARPGPAGTEKDEKPFVSITSTKTYASSPTISTKTGSANVVFNDGNVQVYEVSEVTSTGKSGDSGTEKDEKPFVSITTKKTFGPTGDISTKTGSSQVVYDDGTTKVYEKSEVTSKAKTGAAGTEQQVKPFVKISTSSSYETTGTLGAGEVGSTNKIYDDGTSVVYEKKIDTATARPGPAGIERDVKPFAEIVTTKTYDADNTLPTGSIGSASVVFNDGNVTVYEKGIQTVTARPGLKAIETQAQQWGSLKSTSSYTTSDTAPAGGSVGLVYDGGSVKVYESTTTSATVSGSSKDIDANAWGKLTWTGSYSKSTSGDKSRQVWSNGVEAVYLNETASLQAGGTTKDVDPNAWGSIEWIGNYSTSSSGVKSRQVYNGPGGSVYLNETPTLRISGARFVSAKEESPILKETQTTSYSTAPNSGTNTRSRIAFSLNGQHVYENIDIVRSAKGIKKYQGSVNVHIPATLLSFNLLTFAHKNGATIFRWEPVFSEGFSGPMAAEVREYWSDTPSSAVPTVFRPSPISFQTPRGGISVSSCLHGQHDFLIGILGNGDPEYGPQTWKASFPATTPPTAVGMRILADVDSQPYRDGYVIREYWVQL